MYADYRFYTEDYKGGVIPVTAYDAMARDADSFLDYMTHNRLVMDDLPEKFQSKVKMAACAIAEVCYKQQSDDDSSTVSSEAVGNHSKTFSVVRKTFEQRESEKFNVAKRYLHGTGLMYGGLH